MRIKLLVFPVLVAMLFPVSLSAVADNTTAIEKQIEKYAETNSREYIDIANSLMQSFYNAKIVDVVVEFGDGNPRDSINQQVWYWSSEYFYAHQAYPQALKYGLQALPLCKGDADKANCLSLISLIYFRQSNYEQAANYAKQCYELDEKSGDPDIMSSSLNTLAGIYIGANQPKEAEKYILKGIAFARKANNQVRMAILQGMASEVYHAQGKDQEALKYIEEACEIEKKLGNEYKLMVRLSQKASVLIGLHDYKGAEQLLGKAVPYFEKIGDKQSQAIACNKMGMALLCQGRKDEAVEQFRIAADIFVEIGDRGNEMHSRKGLYESLWSSNPDSAKIELERFNELKDSLYNLASAESLA